MPISELEIDVVRVVALRADRVDVIDQLIAPCLTRAERLRPFVVGIAANAERLAAAYRGDLDEVHRLQGWAAQHYQRNIGKHNVILGLCFTGLAARMQLDLVEAETCYRKALKIAKRSGGSRSHTARLASSLLGELLYERGDLDEAESLLDEGYKLGPEGGPVDFKIARYVTGARIKAPRAIGVPRSDGSARARGSPGRCPCSQAHSWKTSGSGWPSGESGTRRVANNVV